MSIKSILLYTSLLLILSSQGSMLRADSSTPEIDKDRDAAGSMVTMRPLLDRDQQKMPLFEFEAKSPMKNYILMTQEALDKEEISGLKGVVSTALEDEITNYQFAKRIQFSPNEAKTTSWMQIIEKDLQKLARYLPEYSDGLGAPD